MKKIQSVQEFVEKLDAAKKVNPKDLSADQDLTIGIMNLISIEEHLMFSGAKTGKTAFYDQINEIREMRKNMMLKVIPAYEGEVWCISKHLLSAAMRLFEVGTKQLSAGDSATAYDLFDKSYELYCIFWGLNMGMLNEDVNVKSKDSVQKSDKKTAKQIVVPDDVHGDSKMGKLKNWVKKAVNCCIE